MKCIKCNDGEVLKDRFGDMSCIDCGEVISDFCMDLYTSDLHFKNKCKQLEKENAKLKQALQKILGCSGSVSGCFTTKRDIARSALNEKGK